MEIFKDINEEEEWASKVRLIFYELGSTDARYYARNFEHICYQWHKYLFWLLGQGVCH
jgi:hypothetical protein